MGRGRRDLPECLVDDVRVDLLLPLSPALPLLTPIITCTLRSLTTGEYLHSPYFDTKAMSAREKWVWVEERLWAYRCASCSLFSLG